jgi:hypothetical protein
MMMMFGRSAETTFESDTKESDKKIKVENGCISYSSCMFTAMTKTASGCMDSIHY